jgi:hypothetical protein
MYKSVSGATFYFQLFPMCTLVLILVLHRENMSHHQNTGQNHNIKIANSSFENVTKLKYFGMAAANRNFIHAEIKNIKFGYCLLPFRSESLVFLPAN